MVLGERKGEKGFVFAYPRVRGRGRGTEGERGCRGTDWGSGGELWVVNQEEGKGGTWKVNELENCNEDKVVSRS